MGEHELSLTLQLPTTLGPQALRGVLREAHGLGVRRLHLATGEGALPSASAAEVAVEATDSGMDVAVALTGREPTETIAVLARATRQPGARLLEATVPLDGGDVETHDRVHGPGSFARATALLLLAAGHGIATAVVSTVLVPNLGRLEAIVRAASRCGAREVRLLAPIPTPDRIAGGLMPGPDDLARAAHEADALAGVYDIELRLDLSFAAATPYVVCPPLQCTALAVDGAGRALFCPRLPGVWLGQDDCGLTAALASHLAHANGLLACRAGLAAKREALAPCSLYPCALCAARHGLLSGEGSLAEGPWHGLLADTTR